MARVEWTRIAPDDVEHVSAVLLARENPRAQRIRPSRGDGGIDVLVPTGVPSEVDVYQVKGFSVNLTAGQKTQIEKSYARILKTIKDRDLRVRNWYLALPLDATRENLDWLKKLTEKATFNCEWRGLAFLDGLAAKFPDVIDYYLHDGKERLEAAVADLTKLVALGGSVQDSTAGDKTLSPADVQPGLASLHRELNRYDPHYRYDFSVDATRPEIGSQPGLVFAAHFGDDELCITFKVFARFDEATEERPIPIRLTWNVDPNSEEAEHLQQWIKFGTPFEAPLGSATLDLDLPGGLGGKVEGAGVVLGPSEGEGYELRLRVVDASGQAIADALLKMNPVTRGLTGEGVRASGEEANGVFTIEMWMDLAAQSVKMSLRPRDDLSSKRPAEVIPGLRFLAAFRPPHELRFGPAYGPALASGIAIPTDFAQGSEGELVLETVEALATIQGHTAVQIFAPDLSVLTRAQAEGLVTGARLLRGETVTTKWDSFPIRVKPDALASVDPAQTVVRDETFAIRVGDEVVPLGTRRVQLVAARLETPSMEPGEDGLVSARFVPLDGNDEAIMRLIFLPE